MNKKFRIGIVARLKQGDLLDAMTARGWNQVETARFLGISPSAFGGLINMNGVPKSFTAEMTIKLYELTGKTTEELFPEFIQSEEFRSKAQGRRSITFEIDSSRVLDTKEMLRLEASNQMTPDGIFEINEMKDKIIDVLRTLSPKEEAVVKAHILEDVPLDELDKEHNWQEGHARQVVARGIRKLRHPERASRLRDLL